MPNIFDGLRKISDDELIEQIALLETINITNISKPIIQKAKKKTISIINFLGNKIGKKNMIEEPKVKEIWTLIDEKKGELKNCTRIELDKELLNIFIEKSKNSKEDLTEDAISIEVIEEVTKLYKLYNNSTPGQKAENIYLKYCEKLDGRAKEYIGEQPIIDLKETAEDIEEILNNMDEKQKKDFEQSVDIEKVTLLNVWKKLDRQHFARLVWLAVKAYGGKFTPKEEILPSFIEKEKEVEAIKQDGDLRKSQKELLELKNKIELRKEKINSIESSLQEKSDLLNKAIKNKNQAEEEIINLKKINITLEELIKSQDNQLKQLKEQIENALLDKLDSLMEAFKKVKFDSIDTNNKISDINMDITYKNTLIQDTIKEIQSNEKAIKEIGSEFQQFKIEASDLLEAYNEKKQEVHKREEEKRNEIFERWSKFFNKCTFEFNNLKSVVNFNRKELLHVEECLYELQDAKDPMTLSAGLIEDNSKKKEKEEYQYIDVSFANKFQFEIQYKVLDNEEKNLHIVRITTEF